MSSVVSHALVWLPISMGTAIAMDFWAGLLHGRVWHSWLWVLHRSHHRPPASARFEANDALSLLHAPIAVALILFGCAGPAGIPREAAFGVGVGMTAFGLGYVIVHDGLVHGRLPVRWLLRLRYFRSVVRAHRVHHSAPAGGPPFALFFGRQELARARRVMRRSRRSVPPGDPSASASRR